MTRLAALVVGGAVAACGQTPAQTDLPPDVIVSGYTFLTPDTQALQNDDFENPGFLWVDKGEALFREGPKSCGSCHSAGLGGAAISYPKIDEHSGELINLEGRINSCRSRHQDQPEYIYESDDLLALTAYIRAQAKGHRSNVSATGAAADKYAAGKAYFFKRRGQFNLSCSNCHDDNWGKKLRGDTISQGHSNGFPAYRMEWQSLGSLHRRFSDCDIGVRAQPHELGSQTYIDLELYLAARGGALASEAPAVRR